MFAGPYIYLVYIALVVLVLGGTYMKGRLDGREICNNRIAEIQAESFNKERAAYARATQAAAELEDARSQTIVKYRTINKEVEKIVERPVYSNVCLDPDGLRLANSALRNPVPAEPTDAVPGSPRPR